MSHARLRSPTRGFTLIELMVVIVILGGLIAIVGPNIWGQSQLARQKTAHTQMGQLGKALELYRLHNRGRLPDSLDQLLEITETGEALIRKIPRDPWGEDYDYRPEDGTWVLVSGGPDGRLDTEDDLIHPDPEA